MMPAAAVAPVAPIVGHLFTYSDGTWSARGAGWTVSGSAAAGEARAAAVEALARHGYRVEGWRSVPGVAYDRQDPRGWLEPVYCDSAIVRDGRVCSRCGPVSLDLAADARCPGCDGRMFR